MRQLEVTSIFDKVAQAWMQPMFCQSLAQAQRSFSDVVNDSSSDFYKHPEDFALYWIGKWNNDNGELSGMVPELIVSADSLWIPPLDRDWET